MGQLMKAGSRIELTALVEQAADCVVGRLTTIFARLMKNLDDFAVQFAEDCVWSEGILPQLCFGYLRRRCQRLIRVDHLDSAKFRGQVEAESKVDDGAENRRLRNGPA